MTDKITCPCCGSEKFVSESLHAELNWKTCWDCNTKWPQSRRVEPAPDDLAKLVAEFRASQRDLLPDMKKLLYDNLHDLYADLPAPKEVPEITIKGAAVMFENGIVLYGDPPLRHHNLVHFMNIGREEKLSGEQGFMTSDGRFVRRKPAARIALQSRQIEKLKFHSYELFSEDLF